MVELTEKILMEAGGWEAMKDARAMYAAGKVMEAIYAPPVLSGRVRGAEMEFRAGLLIRTRTDIENTCTCPVSRRRGLICAHALAVGVGAIRGMKSQALSHSDPQASTPARAGSLKKDAPSAPVPDPNFGTDVDGSEAALHFILPPNFESAWQKKSVMVVCEIETGGVRKSLGAMDPKKRFRVSEADARLVVFMRRVASGKLPVIVMLGPAQFGDFLAMAAGHPRVTFGKSDAVRIEGQGALEILNVHCKEGGDLSLSLPHREGTLLSLGMRLAICGGNFHACRGWPSTRLFRRVG